MHRKQSEFDKLLADIQQRKNMAGSRANIARVTIEKLQADIEQLRAEAAQDDADADMYDRLLEQLRTFEG